MTSDPNTAPGARAPGATPAGPPAAPGEVLSQAELISRSLKDVTRQMRRPVAVWKSVIQHPIAQAKSSFGVWLAAAFIAVVAMPVLFASLYLALFASDQYASEMRFAVRGGEPGVSDPMASLTGAMSALRNQDSLIVADYIRGRGMVDELEKTLNLRAMFAKGDLVFRFSPDKPIEKLVRYWRWQTDVDIDRMSGIVTVIVRAFTPQDALAIAQAVIAASETLVNDLSDRARRDALKQAQSELALAEKVLADRLRAMQELRNREGILDAGKTSDALTKLSGDMRLELARLESDYAAQKQSVAETSPQMRVLEARIRSTREQIRLIEGRMTATARPAAALPAPGGPAPGAQGGALAGAQAGAGTGTQTGALAESMSRFDRFRLEQDFAQKQYVAAAASLERARMELATQQVYLTTFLQPVLAEDALYPKRLWIMAAITAICLALWGIGTGIAVLMRNYAA
jgi:capsular polysaccharide transport system permease protein